MKKSMKFMATTLLSTAAFNLVAQSVNTVNAQEWVGRSAQEIKQSMANVLENGQVEYEVQWGDTLSSIAQALDMDLETLVSINGIENPDFILAGTLLTFDQSQHSLTIEQEDGQVKEYNTETGLEIIEDGALNQEVAEWVAPVEVAAETEAAAVVEEAPVVEETPVVEEKPVVEEAPVVEEGPVVEEAPVVEESPAVADTTSSDAETAAKEWIAMKESRGDYNAVNPSGKYIGRYQLTASYLNGDYSPENQERVANEYVMNRYGSWVAAQQFWMANGWY